MSSDDEPITAKVRSEVRSEVEKREDARMVQEYRRASDRWNYWTSKIVMVVLGILASCILGLITWLFDVRDTQNRHDIFITQNTASISVLSGDIRELQSSKLANENLAKLINAQMIMMENRIGDQDKRQQMQGEGLIAGNKSIHDALERLMLITNDVAEIRQRLNVIEQRGSKR